VSGSNPNADYTVGPDVVYPTEYRTEILYPLYYNQRRPQPKGLLAQYTYGGPYFNVQLNSDDFFGNVQNVQNTMVVIIRMGFSTHAMVGVSFLGFPTDLMFYCIFRTWASALSSSTQPTLLIGKTTPQPCTSANCLPTLLFSLLAPRTSLWLLMGCLLLGCRSWWALDKWAHRTSFLWRS